MKTLKKSLCLILSVVMVVGVLAVSASAATFTDSESIQYTEAAEVLAAIKVIDGIGDGSFAPTAILTREQGAAYVVRMVLTRAVADTLNASSVTFSDVSATMWSAGVVEYAAQNGIIAGIGDGTFAPNATLTGAQFAKMLLVAIGVDGEYTGNAWFNNVVVASNKIGLTDGISGFNYNNGISREEAAQMTWNACRYSENGSSTAFVVKNEAGTVLYTGTDAMTAVALSIVEGNTLTTAETDVNSISDTVYGLTRETTTDVFGRPIVTITDGKTNGVDVTVSNATPVLTYTSQVTFAKIYSDLGLTRVANNVTVTVDGISATPANGTTFNIQANNTAAVPSTTNGTITEVYRNGSSYSIVVIVPHFTTVSQVTNARVGSTNARVTTVIFEDGRTTTDFTDFAQRDAVIYTYADNKVQSVELANVVTGTLTQVASDRNFTIGNTTYGLSGLTNVTAADVAGEQYSNLGKSVSVYVDGNGYILGVVGQTATTANYIYVLASANPTQNNDYMSSSSNDYTGSVYGILSDGTYGEYTVNYGTSDTRASVNTIYRYTTNNSGQMVLSAPDSGSTATVSGITNGTVSTGTGNNRVYFNGATTYIFFNTATNNAAITTFNVVVGNTNSGNITSGTAILGNNNVASVVFVRGTYSETTSVADVVYVDHTNVSTTVSAGSASVTYNYVGVTSDGTEINVTSANRISASGLYQYNRDNTLGGLQNETEVTVSAIYGSVIVFSDGTAYNFDSASIAFLGDDTIVSVGQKVLTVVERGSITQMWIVDDAPISVID